MNDLPTLGRVAMGAAVVFGLMLAGPAAHAGSGSVLSKMTGELIERFNRAVSPSVPPKTPTPSLEYRPPTPAPGGSVTWSPGQVTDRLPPLESLRGIFNRVGGAN